MNTSQDTTASPLKLAFVLPEFPRLNQAFIVNQLDGVLRRGHDVTIIAPLPPRDGTDHELERQHLSRTRRQVRLAESRLPRTLNGLGLLLRYGWRRPGLTLRALHPGRFGRYALSFATLHGMVPLLDQPTYDIVHCHFGPAGVTAALMQEIGVLHGPMVVTFYGHDVTRYPLQRGAGVYERLFRRARLMLALDPVMRDRLVKLGAPADRVEVHPLSADCERFAPPEARPDPSPLKLLSVGRLVEKKGFEFGLRALAELRDSGRPIHYSIAGAGPLEGELRRLADALELGSMVTFHGNVGHDEVAKLMATSHALLVPSVRAADGDEEGTPTVIIEAMACGLPVVASRHAGIPFLVDEGVTGWLVDERDHVALSACILRLTESDVATSAATAARASALERFEYNRLAAVLESRYAAIIDSPSVRS